MLCLEEITLATLTKCETWRSAMIALFDKLYEKLKAGHLDVKMEMILVWAAIVQIGQLFKIRPK